MTDKKALAREIREFIEKHAGIAANYDPKYDSPEDRFSSPDASMLEAAANLLDEGRDIEFYVDSEWGSGGYHPYNDESAKAWHNTLVEKANALRVHPTPSR
jgi:hypothetical protein